MSDPSAPNTDQAPMPPYQPPYPTSNPAEGGAYPPYPPGNPYPPANYPPGNYPPGNYPPANYPPASYPPYPPAQPPYPTYPNPAPQQPPPSQPAAPAAPKTTQPKTTTTIIIQNGNCPKCLLGNMEDHFTPAGLCMACLFFPIGIICCLRMKKRVCNHCKYAQG